MEFDALISKTDKTLLIASSALEHNDDLDEAVGHLIEAVEDLKCALVKLAAHVTMPREVDL